MPPKTLTLSTMSRSKSVTGCDGTPPRPTQVMDDEFLKRLDTVVDEMTCDLAARKYPQDLTTGNNLARHLKTNTADLVSKLTDVINEKAEDALHLTTPSYSSATVQMSSGKLKRGTIHIYIASYAWPDEHTAIKTKRYLEELIKRDNFGAFDITLKEHMKDEVEQGVRDDLLEEDEFEATLRKNPALTWKNFENMWINDQISKGITKLPAKGITKLPEFTQDEFRTWFRLEHLSKLGMCWKQNSKAREQSYRSIGELSLGVRKYFPVVYEIKWDLWNDDERKQFGAQSPAQQDVAYKLEEYLQNDFLSDVSEMNPGNQKSSRRKKSDQANSSSQKGGGMVNETNDVNTRMFKWEYIFNMPIEEVQEKVEKKLNFLKYDKKTNQGQTFDIVGIVHDKNTGNAEKRPIQCYVSDWTRLGYDRGDKSSRRVVKVPGGRNPKARKVIPMKLGQFEYKCKIKF